MVPRLVIHRGLSSPLIAGSKQRLELLLGTEFNEPQSDLRALAVFASFLPSLDLLLSIEEPVTDAIALSCCGFRGKVGIFEFEVPPPGNYYMRIWTLAGAGEDGVTGKHPCGIDGMMLSLITENFLVVGVSERGTQPARRALLCCFRYVVDPLIVVKEEYGATLGSHVYDSSIVMMRYLKTRLQCSSESSILDHIALPDWREGAVLELGSGCGLLGLWLSTFFKFVHMTDKICQMDLMRENVDLNKSWLAQKCSCAPLEWHDPDRKGLIALEAHLRVVQVPLNLIVAADVFYDTESATSLFRVLEELTSTVAPKALILMAQKLRCDTAAGSDSLSLQFPYIEGKFSWKVLHSERQVRILQFSRL